MTASVAWSRTVSRLFECAALTVICVIEPVVPLGLAAIAAVYLYAMRD